jgi:hypothetical protein
MMYLQAGEQREKSRRRRATKCVQREKKFGLPKKFRPAMKARWGVAKGEIALLNHRLRQPFLKINRG